ncbi:MAG: type II toxin-antitoxin system PemK/MazF family toxin [Candidatus Nanoarchaeia archaeon]|nr:type II toxin-antitoxin system PemK/MazF family toxin [Candidatus Nanoarchaeia archaeon]MDD5740969.1 type II toxin-antitoxin system PemK/MazF family toxin [Candidatus Nanoarchaeia archaeon]
MIEQKDLLLVPFPFSDQSGRKVRPVIVISNNEFNKYSDDVLVIGVTSNILKDKYTLNLTNTNLDEGKLLTNCIIKVENLLKLDKELVIKKIGKINKETLKNIIDKLFTIINY